jgi:hypothetical protein
VGNIVKSLLLTKETNEIKDVARSSTIKRSELAKIPFIDSGNVGGRVLTTLTFYEEGEWQMWFPLPTGLIRMKGEPGEADYFARMPEKDTDIYLDFLNFMTQRACWVDAMRAIDGIRNDIHNLGASLGKLELFHRASRDNRFLELRRFASTEVEYIFGVCRSLFDLLQEVIATLWQRIKLLDEAVRKKQLPKSFRRMVIRDEKLMSVEAIETRWCVPKVLASFYHRHGSFFEILRRYRDDVVHSGRDFKSIFVTEKGFAVSADVEPFASLGVWTDEHMLPNRLASLRPVVAHVITETLRACEDFAQSIQRIIQFPPEIAPGFRLFLRGFHNRYLLTMKTVLSNCEWWEAEHVGPPDR